MRNLILYLLFCIFAVYNGSAQSLRTMLSEHAADVEAITVSYDGKQMASGSWDGKINLYQFDSSGNPVLKETYSGHMSAVTTLQFSGNGKYLVSGSKDFTVRIWNIDTPSAHKVIRLHREPVTSAFLEPGGKYIISSSQDGTIRITLLSDLTKSRQIIAGSPVNDLVISRDRKFYYAAVKGGIVKKIETGGKNREIAVFQGHSDEVNAIELSPDGRFLATASSDKTILIWDVLTGKTVRTLKGFEWKVTSLQFSPDGKHIAGGCNNGVAKLFEVESGKVLSDFNETGKNVRDVAFSHDGSMLLVATLADGKQHGAVIYNSGIRSVPLRVNQRPGQPARQVRPNSKSVKLNKNNGAK